MEGNLEDTAKKKLRSVLCVSVLFAVSNVSVFQGRKPLRFVLWEHVDCCQTATGMLWLSGLGASGSVEGEHRVRPRQFASPRSADN